MRSLFHEFAQLTSGSTDHPLPPTPGLYGQLCQQEDKGVGAILKLDKTGMLHCKMLCHEVGWWVNVWT